MVALWYCGAAAATMVARVIDAREEATTELDLGLAQRDFLMTCWVTYVRRGNVSLGHLDRPRPPRTRTCAAASDLSSTPWLDGRYLDSGSSGTKSDIERLRGRAQDS
jgi:hypothetical protein